MKPSSFNTFFFSHAREPHSSLAAKANNVSEAQEQPLTPSEADKQSERFTESRTSKHVERFRNRNPHDN